MGEKHWIIQKYIIRTKDQGKYDNNAGGYDISKIEKLYRFL